MIEIKEDEEANKAIEQCSWRRDVCGVAVCAGMCYPCSKVIENGTCDTLTELFKKKIRKRGGRKK